MWQRFTERARRLVFFAQEEARRLGENYVSTEHLLLGLTRENGSVAARILDRMGVSLERVRSEVERQVARGDGRLGQDMQLTPRAKRVIDLAYDEARQLSNKYIGTEHLLLGMIREGEGLAGRVLAKLGVELERTRAEVRTLQDNDSVPSAATFPEASRVLKTPGANQTLFANAWAILPADQQQTLQREGIPLHRLPDALQIATRLLLGQAADNRVIALDPNAVVRVSTDTFDASAHYTVTTSASVMIGFHIPNPPAA